MKRADEPKLDGSHTVADFSGAHTAALSVAPGQTFTVETRDRFAPLAAGADEPAPNPGALVGPVDVAGVRAGSVLAIEIVDIRPRSESGYLLGSPGYGILGDRIETRVRPVRVTATDVQLVADVVVPARPMIGKLGVAPAQPRPGNVSGTHGGALSAIELGPGSTLLVEVARDGAGICIEDVHALMGDGEATASAVEMPATVRLRASPYGGSAEDLPRPLLLTRSEAICFAEADTLDEAAEAAVDTMVALIMARRGVDRTDAALLAGAAAHVRISFFGAQPRRARAAIARELVRL